jgi:hypothetical protein
MGTKLDFPLIFSIFISMEFVSSLIPVDRFPDPLKSDSFRFRAGLPDEDFWGTTKPNKPACGNACRHEKGR